MTLPGSLIAGNTFSVLTPEQIQHFKPMLCMDNNGFLSSSVISGDSSDMKTTHIVIQQQQQQQGDQMQGMQQIQVILYSFKT